MGNGNAVESGELPTGPVDTRQELQIAWRSKAMPLKKERTSRGER